MNNYRDLKVWQRSVDFAVEVYKITDVFPSKEKYALCSQINRSVVSISSNIAEGAGRNSNGEFKLFLGYAFGSLCELETQLLIAKKLEYLKNEKYENILKESSEIGKMLRGLTNSLN